MSDERYDSFMGFGPRRIAHWEHWSNPDAESYLTGIDYYAHPRLCRLKLKELYPELSLYIPAADEPITRPEEQPDQSKGRWGDSYRDHWRQDVAGHRFATHEEMLRFSPLAHADFTGWHVVEDGDFTSEERSTSAIGKTTRRHGVCRLRGDLPPRSPSTTQCSCGRC